MNSRSLLTKFEPISNNNIPCALLLFLETIPVFIKSESKIYLILNLISCLFLCPRCDTIEIPKLRPTIPIHKPPTSIAEIKLVSAPLPCDPIPKPTNACSGIGMNLPLVINKDIVILPPVSQYTSPFVPNVLLNDTDPLYIGYIGKICLSRCVLRRSNNFAGSSSIAPSAFTKLDNDKTIKTEINLKNKVM